MESKDLEFKKKGYFYRNLSGNLKRKDWFLVFKMLQAERVEVNCLISSKYFIDQTKA